jgi:hypothetical protein
MSHWMKRERLMRQTYSGPGRARFAVTLCAAGMLIVVLLATIGAGSGDEYRVDRSARSGANGAVAPSTARAETHRKHVFEERRERFFHGNGATKSVANEVVEP